MAGQGQHGDGPVRRDRATVGWLWRALAAVIVAARYLILLGWIAAAVAVTLYLPPLTASDAAVSDLTRVAVVIALVVLVLLALLLRAVVAPFYLLAASVLALLASLGLTVWIFQGILGAGSLVYYVPFVVAVLLISLGSDYNVFVVGRIWEEARRRPLREAVAVAAPRASRAITTAGLALAAGFGLLALVPLAQFREIAVAMALGILLDTFVVRSLLVPALVVLFGRVGSWPGRTVPPVRRLAASPAAEDLHGTVAHRD